MRTLRRLFPSFFIFDQQGPDPNNYLLPGTHETLLVDSCTTLMGNPFSVPEFSRVSLLVNTHPHIDHVAGNDYFPNANVAVLAECAEVLRRQDAAVQVAAPYGVRPPAHPVNRILSDGEILDLGDLSLTVLSTPGHCTGALCLYDEKNKALISGDTVFTQGSIPRTDFPTGNLPVLVETYERLMQLEVAWILPGHGPVEGQASKILKDAHRLLQSLL